MIDIPFSLTFRSSINEKKKNKLFKILNDGQQELVNKAMALKRGNVLRVTGYAGTGKTFAVSWFVRLLAETSSKIAVCAPTHTAKDVLIEKIGLSSLDAYNLEYSTIQSLLGLMEVVDNETGEISFKQNPKYIKKEIPITQYRWVFIDESSMICPVLLNMIHKAWLSSKMILVFIGDPVQVPPVGYDNSVVFTYDFDEKFNPIDVHLTDIVRQGKDSDIINLSLEIRKNLTASPEKMLEICRKYVHLGGDVKPLESLNKQIFPIYKSEEYRNNPKLIKTIAFRRKTCNRYGDAIRDFVLGDHYSNPIVGDIMVFNEPYVDGDTIVFKNKEEVLIQEEKDTTITFNYKQFRAKKFLLKRLKTGEYDEECENDMETAYHVIFEDKQPFLDEVNRFYNFIISKPEKERRNYWPIFWSQKRLVANWSYIYTLTAHKSQGATYRNAVVDVYDILNNTNAIIRNRILYTAITRASHIVYLRVIR